MSVRHGQIILTDYKKDVSITASEWDLGEAYGVYLDLKLEERFDKPQEG